MIDAYIYQALEPIEPGSLIVVRGDRPTFALWYGVYAEGQRPDVAIVSGPLLAFIWYREYARQLYPDLVIPEPRSVEVTINDLTRDLIFANLPHRAVYATDPSDTVEDWVDFVPEGTAPVYRARGLEEAPEE
jgi:hypothetical protein